MPNYDERLHLKTTHSFFKDENDQIKIDLNDKSRNNVIATEEDMMTAEKKRRRELVSKLKSLKEL